MAQTPDLPTELIRVDAGISNHSTGDMAGYIISTEYIKFFKPKLAWSAGINTSIHDGAVPLGYADPDNNPIDASIRYTTGGVQLAGKFIFTPVRSEKHTIGISFGALGRYQSTSYFDTMSISYPQATGLPYPVVTFINRNPQRTLAIGGITQLFYQYTLNKKIFLGFTTGAQADSNGDMLSQLAFTVGFNIY